MYSLNIIKIKSFFVMKIWMKTVYRGVLHCGFTRDFTVSAFRLSKEKYCLHVANFENSFNFD